MTSAPHLHSLDLTAEMARLHSAGFSLLPLGGGPDGKAPLLGFAGTERLPLKRLLAPMHRKGSTCYGIRLGGLVVVDCDTDEPSLVSAMEARFGASPVHVRTPRGRHLYYRAPEDAQPAYPNLKADGLAVDLKRGPNHYVMGPGSTRPDGGAYVTAKGVLGLDGLPVIVLPPAARSVQRPALGEPVGQGARHQLLLQAAISMVASVASAATLYDALRAIRDRDCADPESVPDAEVLGVAEWAWGKRLEGRIYSGRNSAFAVDRQALDVLRGDPNQSDALALYVTLQDQHGHKPGYAFALDHEGMLKAGLTNLSRRAFRAARKTLVSRGLLRMAAHHSAGRRARTYRLCRPLALEDLANVAWLARAGGPGGAGSTREGV